MDEQVLRLLIKAEVDQAVRSLDQLKDKAGATESAALKVGDALSAAAFAASVATIKKGIDAYIGAEQALVKLNAVYKATNGAVGLTTDELVAFSSELEATTGIADDAAMQMESLLLTFKNIQGDAFKETARLAVDLAAVMGGDLNGAALTLGKALEDPANGVAMLNRQLRLFSEAEVEVLKNLTETGRAAEAQALILEALEGKVGGTAAAMQDTLGGALRDAGNALDNLLELLGEGFAPVLEIVAGGVENVAKALQNVDPAILAGTASVIAMTTGVNGLAAAAVALGIKLPAAFGPIGIAVAGVTAAIVLLTSAYAENEAAIKKLNEEQEKLLQLQKEITGAFEAATMTSGIDAQIQANLDLIATLKEENRLLQESHNFNAATIEFNNTQIAQAEQLIVSLRQQKQEQEALAAAQAEAAREAARIAAEELARRERLLTQEKVMIRANRERAEALRTATAAAIAQAKAEETAAEMLAKARAIEEYNSALADLAQAYADLDADDTDAKPFQAMIDGANAFKDALSYWGPAIQGVQGLLGELDAQWKAENAARIAGMEREIELEQLRYSNQISLARAAGQETRLLEQEAADAALTAATRLDEEKAKIAKAEFERDKAAKLVGIAMATAQGVANALSLGVAGIPLAGLIGGLGAAQAAVVAGSKYPGLANGGTVTGGGTVMVGERGPELLNLPRAATVTPLGKASGGVTVVIQGGTFIGSGGLDEAVIAIKKRMGQLERTGVLA